MRPRGYDPVHSTRFYDPRTGRYVGRSFDDLLRVAGEIAKERDRAEANYDRAVARLAEGVPQARASYWRRRLSETRTDLAEKNAFYREIDQQIDRATRKEQEQQRRADRERVERERRAQEAEAERKRREEPRAVEFSLNLAYDRRLGAAPASEVDIEVRFWRTDKRPITMREAWDAVNAYRASGQFPPDFEVASIDWLGIAAKRRGRPKTSMVGPSAQVDTALSDFFGILHSVDRKDLQLDFVPLRLGSVKEDG